MKRAPAIAANRPMPPDELEPFDFAFVPARDVTKWIEAQILAEEGSLYNVEHRHLRYADFEVLWASRGFDSKGRTVIGFAEEVTFRCNKWQKHRQEQQMREWFGRVPDYLITLDANFARTCSDVDWCALVEHELYHIGQERDEFGNLAFKKDGTAKLAMRGHDVEEFVGVVRRYGVGEEKGAVAQLVEAANRAPEVGRLQIATACGTCMRLVA